MFLLYTQITALFSYCKIYWNLQSIFKFLYCFRTQYYFTKGHEHLGEAINVNDEQSPFLYPPCSLMFSYFQYWKAKKRTTEKEQRLDVSMMKRAEEFLRMLRVSIYSGRMDVRSLDVSWSISEGRGNKFKWRIGTMRASLGNARRV